MKKILLLVCLLGACSTVLSEAFIKSVANQEFELVTTDGSSYSWYTATFDSSGNMSTDFSYKSSNSGGSSTGSYRLLKTTSDTVGIYEAGSSYTKVEVSGSTLKVYESVNSESGAESQTSVEVTLNKQ